MFKKVSGFRPDFYFFQMVAFFLTIISFQNCSKVKFRDLSLVDEASMSSAADDSALEPNSLFRIQTIQPSFTSVENAGDVKVLLVVDNSPTMQNSQENLTKNLDSLLGKIKDYTAQVKVVSTTLYDDRNCGDTCFSKPVMAMYRGIASLTVNGKPGNAYSMSMGESSKNVIFNFTKTMTAAEKTAVIANIATRVKDLGTRGLDNEAQFAAMAVYLDSSISNFFKKGDKALVYILTDEDDSYSISGMTEKKSLYYETAQWSNVFPGISFSYSGYQSGSGSCNSYDEAGNYTGTIYMSPGPGYKTLSACNEFLDAVSAHCSYGACSLNTGIPYNGARTLDGKDLTTRCQELTVEYSALYPITRCYPQDVITYDNETINYRESRILGIETEVIDTATDKTDLVLKTVKKRVDDLFGSKYLIGVSANMPGQSCALKTGQSNDVFCSKTLPKYFPTSNLLVSSICDANTDNTAVKRVAAEFENILSNDYLLTLGPKDSIEKVVVHIGSLDRILIDKVDYEIRNNTFKILATNLGNFDKIEIKIKTVK